MKNMTTKSHKLHVKTGDTVKVIAGNEKGKTGRITSVDINAKKVIIEELTTITGQKAVATKAKNSVSNFKLREGMPIGARVTLRGEQMYEFMDRLLTIALPRVRDFKGVSDKG